ncbi:hypothetical protein ACQKWADRAFT_205410 [Trichoderma austrokoningii]
MAAKLFAHELEAYNDADLDRYLEENGRLVSVQDPRNLSEHFIQRLSRDRVHGSDNTPSLPVDLAQVTARLLQIGAAEEEAAARPANYFRSVSSSPLLPSPESQRIEEMESEKKYYNELIADGGRPWYPIHLLETVSKNPKDYHEFLRFWEGDHPDMYVEAWCNVFAGQAWRWQQFREWQAKNRDRFKDNFSKHTQLARKQLAKYSFTQPFEFHPDPKQQDKLTEWIEYMSYEYTIYKRFEWAKRGERGERRYNKAWQELVDSQVLQPDEKTIAFILSDECERRRRTEVTGARQAVESAKDVLSSAQQAVAAEQQQQQQQQPSHPSSSSSSSSHAQQRLAAAQSELDSATKSLEFFEKRNRLILKFCNGTFNYRNTKRTADRHDILMQWIRDQVPLIEQEMKQADGGGGGGGEEEDGEEEGGAGAKRQKCHGDEPLSTIGRNDAQSFREASTADAPHLERPKSGAQDCQGDAKGSSQDAKSFIQGDAKGSTSQGDADGTSQDAKSFAQGDAKGSTGQGNFKGTSQGDADGDATADATGHDKTASSPQQPRRGAQTTRKRSHEGDEGDENAQKPQEKKRRTMSAGEVDAETSVGSEKQNPAHVVSTLGQNQKRKRVDEADDDLQNDARRKQARMIPDPVPAPNELAQDVIAVSHGDDAAMREQRELAKVEPNSSVSAEKLSSFAIPQPSPGEDAAAIPAGTRSPGRVPRRQSKRQRTPTPKKQTTRRQRKPRENKASPLVQQIVQSSRSSRRGPAQELLFLDNNGTACVVVAKNRN